MTDVERTSPSALTFARLLGDGPMAKVALEASLGQLDSAAFIVSESGTVLHANAEGLKTLERSNDSVRERLAALVTSLGRIREGAPEAIEEPGEGDDVFITALRCETMPCYFLIILRPPSSTAAGIEYAASMWELTPRQKEVLTLLADGFSNKTIAARLGCAERTVETHLTAIFQKSGFDGRSALLAALAKNRR